MHSAVMAYSAPPPFPWHSPCSSSCPRPPSGSTGSHPPPARSSPAPRKERARPTPLPQPRRPGRHAPAGWLAPAASPLAAAAPPRRSRGGARAQCAAIKLPHRPAARVAGAGGAGAGASGAAEKWDRRSQWDTSGTVGAARRSRGTRACRRA